MKIMYKINQYEHLTHYTVTPIRIVRSGILSGCSMESITAIDHDGHKFSGNPENYFETEEAAWAHVRSELIDNIQFVKEKIKNLSNTIRQLEMVISSLPNTENISKKR